MESEASALRQPEKYLMIRLGINNYPKNIGDYNL